MSIYQWVILPSSRKGIRVLQEIWDIGVKNCLIFFIYFAVICSSGQWTSCLSLGETYFFCLSATLFLCIILLKFSGADTLIYPTSAVSLWRSYLHMAVHLLTEALSTILFFFHNLSRSQRLLWATIFMKWFGFYSLWNSGHTLCRILVTSFIYLILFSLLRGQKDCNTKHYLLICF